MVFSVSIENSTPFLDIGWLVYSVQPSLASQITDFLSD